MKNLLKTHENLVIFPLKYSQDFNGFWFPSELSQSYYNTDKTITLNSTHHCIYEFPSNNEQSMICRELSINKNDYLKATNDPFSFVYIDKPRKCVTKNFNEKI